ncbi:response regulator transcription factor [Humibacillus xanthopallidus]
MSTVMVVDDEERIRSLLSRSLSSEGHTVITASSGSGALALMDTASVDLVLLDLLMPGGNGMMVLSALGQRHERPAVIVLSGVTDVGARVQAFERGAVDVIAKPFTLAELLARVRRSLPSGAPGRDDRYVTVGGLRLDLDRRRARLDGLDVSLTEREFMLLAHLMQRAGAVCRREELLHDVWGLDFDPGSNLVEVCVGRLRAKLGPAAPIETVRRVGYCLLEE